MMAGVTTTHPATHAARVLVQALAALGVEDVVLAPGSRSAPLAYAFADAGVDADSEAGSVDLSDTCSIWGCFTDARVRQGHPVHDLRRRLERQG